VKVLVTGANGFLGSHIIDKLLEAPGFEVAILLRRTSDTSFIANHLQGNVTVYYGSLSDGEALQGAVAGADAVIHCAAKTKALREADYFTVNREGTENMVRAATAGGSDVRHFIFISSLAVSGPGTTDAPARETDSPRPLTTYGRSKRDAEAAVQRMDRVPWTILRPAAVYGPRDRDFLQLFQAAKRGIVLLPGRGRQPLSLAYVSDVAEAVRLCLGDGRAAGKIYHVAAPVPTSAVDLAHAIAVAINRSIRTVSVPGAVLYLACMAQDCISQISRRPHILSRQKWPEICAPGWVCATDRIHDELGFTAPTPMEDGLRQTVAWYSQRGWI
jgi:nucleoside-diphosphate-sugar epimerase